MPLPHLPEAGGTARLFRGEAASSSWGATCQVVGTQEEELGLGVSGQCWLRWSEGRWV